MNVTELQQMFPLGIWPEFVSLDMHDQTCLLKLTLNPELHWFAGHFPDQPVLAGVVQTHWAAEFGKTLFPLGEGFQRMDNLKFQTVILPGQTVDLHLQYLPAIPAVKFSYQCGDTLCSEGKLLFNATDSNLNPALP